jgi:hypothetical protein
MTPLVLVSEPVTPQLNDALTIGTTIICPGWIDALQYLSSCVRRFPFRTGLIEIWICQIDRPEMSHIRRLRRHDVALFASERQNITAFMDILLIYFNVIGSLVRDNNTGVQEDRGC